MKRIALTERGTAAGIPSHKENCTPLPALPGPYSSSLVIARRSSCSLSLCAASPQRRVPFARASHLTGSPTIPVGFLAHSPKYQI